MTYCSGDNDVVTVHTMYSVLPACPVCSKMWNLTCHAQNGKQNASIILV